jgi:hypothetical protein
MTPTEYLVKIVDPTIAEYESAQSNFRRALLASITLIHTHDYLKKIGSTCEETTERFFAKMNDNCFGAYDLYCFAIAGKHTFHRNSGLTIDNIQPRPPAFWETFELDRSHFDDEAGAVEIEICVNNETLNRYRRYYQECLTVMAEDRDVYKLRIEIMQLLQNVRAHLNTLL